MSTQIEATDLAKSFGDIHAVRGVSFSVSDGEIFALLGRNGSGKSTIVRMLTTLTRPTSGSGAVAGLDIVSQAGQVRSLIGVTMQDAALDEQMTATEHIFFIASLLGFNKQDAVARSGELLETFGLTESADRQIAGYSGGMKRRLDIATSLLGHPKVLFLDEPTTGLDPQSRLALWAEIKRIKARGATIFLTTQYLEEADQLADHLAIIDKGQVIAAGSVKSIKADHGRKRLSFATSKATTTAVADLGTDPRFDVQTQRDGADYNVIIEVSAEISDADLVQLAGRLTTSSSDVRDIQMTGANLEDVFLRLTGSAINEDAENTKAPA